jgi:4-diphosphocytidyl-2-C-methyl-D-erythritol kinase
LVVRAAELLRSHTGAKRGVLIELQKRIPVAAGLAGGSSNAAATLAALNHLWRLSLAPGELQELAARLGSDIGFFLSGVTAAVCRGRGERTEPLALPLNLHFVVVKPKAGLSTAEVYRHCEPSSSPQRVHSLVDALRYGRLAEAGGRLHNALEVPAERLITEVRQLRSWFSRQSVLGHQMSGSGTAYFGLCGNRRQALSIAARLRAEQLGRAFVVQCRP